MSNVSLLCLSIVAFVCSYVITMSVFDKCMCYQFHLRWFWLAASINKFCTKTKKKKNIRSLFKFIKNCNHLKQDFLPWIPKSLRLNLLHWHIFIDYIITVQLTMLQDSEERKNVIFWLKQTFESFRNKLTSSFGWGDCELSLSICSE